MTPFITIDYPIYVGDGLLDQAGALVKPRGRVFVITSTNLRARFGDRVAASFESAPDVVTFEEGESRKTLATANEIITQLLDRGAKRDSMAIVVGGGMVGDTAGFAASIFLRGIDLVQVPTTLLAQVDSSIGGKVAVNHAKGKNLIGSFHPPRAVLADTSVLASLPHRETLSGMFEALKGGVIGDAALFEIFERHEDNISDIVRRAIRVKAEIVSRDERETDLRRLLNYGHTVAHGIEAAMSYEGITHGEAVAWGMIAANSIAVKRGLLARDVADRIERVIRSYEPAPLPRSIDAEAIFAATEHDKKNTGSARVMVLPRSIGDCVVVSDVREEEIRDAIGTLL